MNTERFTGLAKTYAKYRPSYPQEFMEYLYSEVGFGKDRIVADIGSGTGIFSRQLLDGGSKVFCVEPNGDMRKTAESDLAGYPGFVSVTGTAERTALPDKSVDYITVAQAFHWFDAEKFKTECQRILKPEGRVVLVWNSRVKDSELAARTVDICRRLCSNFKGFSGGSEEKPEVFSSFYKYGAYEFRTFKNDLTFDLNGFIGRHLSSSYAPKETEPNYRRYVDELTALFMEHSAGGVLTMPNITRSYTGKV